MPEIRKARLDDSDALHRLSAVLGYADSGAPAARARLEAILENSDERVWVFEDTTGIHGWIHVFTARRLASPAFAEIGGLVVDDARRREGIGRQLVARAQRWAGRRDLTLRVRCNATRDEANRFYADLGFACCKTQKIHEIG